VTGVETTQQCVCINGGGRGLLLKFRNVIEKLAFHFFRASPLAMPDKYMGGNVGSKPDKRTDGRKT